MKKVDWFSIFVTTALLTFSVRTEAQQTGKPHRIGYLTGGSPSSAGSRIEPFRQGLREVGYAEGKNIVIEWRFAEGKLERLPELAADLVRLNVLVIVTGGPQVTRVAKQATSTIPIVMAQDGDPVGNGFVASLAHPGGNITGLSTIAPEISGKRLELLKETVPKLSRVAVFGTSTSANSSRELKEMELAASALQVKLQYFDVLGSKDIETAFRGAIRERSDAVLENVSASIINFQRQQIVDLAVKNKLPVIYDRAINVETGGLMSYGVSLPDLDRRAATYVDKILKGAKPADLPVEQPKKFEFVINLKSAKQIGLAIPPNVLARADKVIR